jgi:hypothetical protein
LISVRTMSGPNDPKMREREAKLTGTVAMGMKMSRVAASCWVDSCRKEEKIREDWQRLYDPEHSDKEADIIKRVMEREKERHQRAESSPERKLLYDGVSKDGMGRKAYLKERLKLPPQQRFGNPTTASQVVGWDSLRVPPPRNPDLPSFGHKRSTLTAHK